MYLIKSQKLIYKLAYNIALKKYPDARDAIIGGMDYPEYIGIHVPRLCNTHAEEVSVSRAYLTDHTKCEECVKFDKKLQDVLK